MKRNTEKRDNELVAEKSHTVTNIVQIVNETQKRASKQAVVPATETQKKESKKVPKKVKKNVTTSNNGKNTEEDTNEDYQYVITRSTYTRKNFARNENYKP